MLRTNILLYLIYDINKNIHLFIDSHFIWIITSFSSAILTIITNIIA